MGTGTNFVSLAAHKDWATNNNNTQQLRLKLLPVHHRRVSESLPPHRVDLGRIAHRRVEVREAARVDEAGRDIPIGFAAAHHEAGVR